MKKLYSTLIIWGKMRHVRQFFFCFILFSETVSYSFSHFFKIIQVGYVQMKRDALFFLGSISYSGFLLLQFTVIFMLLGISASKFLLWLIIRDIIVISNWNDRGEKIQDISSLFLFLILNCSIFFVAPTHHGTPSST